MLSPKYLLSNLIEIDFRSKITVEHFCIKQSEYDVLLIIDLSNQVISYYI